MLDALLGCAVLVCLGVRHLDSVDRKWRARVEAREVWSEIKDDRLRSTSLSPQDSPDGFERVVRLERRQVLYPRESAEEVGHEQNVWSFETSGLCFFQIDDIGRNIWLFAVVLIVWFEELIVGLLAGAVTWHSMQFSTCAAQRARNWGIKTSLRMDSYMWVVP